jgi:WD40 repeat protein
VATDVPCATASFDETAKVWNAESGAESATLAGHTGPVQGVAFSPDRSRVATANVHQTAKVWDITTSGACDLVRPSSRRRSCGKLSATIRQPASTSGHDARH